MQVKKPTWHDQRKLACMAGQSITSRVLQVRSKGVTACCTSKHQACIVDGQAVSWLQPAVAPCDCAQVLESKGYTHPHDSAEWARHPVFVQSFEVSRHSNAKHFEGSLQAIPTKLCWLRAVHGPCRGTDA